MGAGRQRSTWGACWPASLAKATANKRPCSWLKHGLKQGVILWPVQPHHTQGMLRCVRALTHTHGRKFKLGIRPLSCDAYESMPHTRYLFWHKMQRTADCGVTTPNRHTHNPIPAAKPQGTLWKGQNIRAGGGDYCEVLSPRSEGGFIRGISTTWLPNQAWTKDTRDLLKWKEKSHQVFPEL